MKTRLYFMWTSWDHRLPGESFDLPFFILSPVLSSMIHDDATQLNPKILCTFITMINEQHIDSTTCTKDL